jgi:hypothetical protein
MLQRKAICINCRRPVQKIECKQHTDQGHTVLVLPSECKVTFAPKRRDGRRDGQRNPEFVEVR